MLVLTMKELDNIFIENNISIKLLAINGNQIKLGFDAPKAISIDRESVRASKTLCIESDEFKKY